MRHGSFCTGYGGLDMAAQAVFGGELAWWSDIEPGPIAVMEYHHPGVPNIGDIKTADWSQTPAIDVLTAGYPCQPFSNAGKRLGTEDPRHLWPHIAGAIGILRPRFVVLENVAAHLRRGFDVVLADLTALGYDAAWTLVRASDVGAAHRRERLFVVAADSTREPSHGRGSRESAGRMESPDNSLDAISDAYSGRVRTSEIPEPGRSGPAVVEHTGEGLVDWRQYEPAIRRWESRLGVPAPYPAAVGPRGGTKVSPAFGEWLMGVPGRITSVPGLSINDRLKLVGNGVVPQQAEFAIRGLLGRLCE